MRLNLKIFRVRHGMTQTEIAKTLGVCRSYFGHIERGFMRGSKKFWDRMQAEFGLTDAELERLKEIA